LGHLGKLLCLLGPIPFAATLRRFFLGESSMATPGLRLFYSYSHIDKIHRNELAKHLVLLRREGKIAEWFDGMIVPGKPLDPTIKENLRQADIVLLLISADFLDSDYCWDVEMQTALKRNRDGTTLVIPIMVRPVEDGWRTTMFGELKALPSDAKPITTWTNSDEAWANVADGIRHAVDDINKSRKSI